MHLQNNQCDGISKYEFNYGPKLLNDERRKNEILSNDDQELQFKNYTLKNF